MRSREVYEARCECGALLTSDRRAVHCPACGRVIEFDWTAAIRELERKGNDETPKG